MFALVCVGLFVLGALLLAGALMDSQEEGQIHRAAWRKGGHK